ncbi:MAG: RlmE family RNA methyltransferase [Aquisalinus sp.]|nr:RlmE family RNA methyltransferase [Aquisalinus sp.]
MEHSKRHNSSKKAKSRSANKPSSAQKKSDTKKTKSHTNISRTALGVEPEKRGLKSRPTGDADQRAKRELATKVKTAKGRKLSSTLWLKRQLNDPFVAKAKAEGFRSRAAYKLQEIDEKYHLLRKGARVVDLGAAPGGWCQIAAKAVGPSGKVVGIDYLAMPPVPGTQVLEMDFLDHEAPDKLKALLDGAADVVLSDMAAPTTGHPATDHLRIIALAETALDFAEEVLADGGHFVAKVFQGGADHDLLVRLKKNFRKVLHAKPKASRQDSAEMYVVATGFRGKKA